MRALKDALDAVATDQGGMIARAFGQMYRLAADLGVWLGPAFEIKFGTGAVGPHQELECRIVDSVASGHGRIGCFETQSPIGVEAKAAEGEQTVDLQPQVASLGRVRNHCV